MKKVLCYGAVAILAMAPLSQASLSIINGDFNTGYALGANIDGWASVTTGNFWDNAFWDSPGGDPLVNMSINPSATSTNSTDPLSGSWFYQGIGTSDGAADVQLSLDWGSFDVNFSSALRVALYEDTAGTFVQANDVDVEGALTLVGSQTFTGVSVVGETVTFDLSGVGAANNLYLRINNYDPGTGTQWTYADNVQIIPEPATIGLVGVFGAGVLFIRRRLLM